MQSVRVSGKMCHKSCTGPTYSKPMLKGKIGRRMYKKKPGSKGYHPTDCRQNRRGGDIGQGRVKRS